MHAAAIERTGTADRQTSWRALATTHSGLSRVHRRGMRGLRIACSRRPLPQRDRESGAHGRGQAARRSTASRGVPAVRAGAPGDARARRGGRSGLHVATHCARDRPRRTALGAGTATRTDASEARRRSAAVEPDRRRKTLRRSGTARGRQSRSRDDRAQLSRLELSAGRSRAHEPAPLRSAAAGRPAGRDRSRSEARHRRQCGTQLAPHRRGRRAQGSAAGRIPCSRPKAASCAMPRIRARDRRLGPRCRPTGSRCAS